MQRLMKYEDGIVRTSSGLHLCIDSFGVRLSAVFTKKYCSWQMADTIRHIQTKFSFRQIFIRSGRYIAVTRSCICYNVSVGYIIGPYCHLPGCLWDKSSNMRCGYRHISSMTCMRDINRNHNRTCLSAVNQRLIDTKQCNTSIPILDDIISSHFEDNKIYQSPITFVCKNNDDTFFTSILRRNCIFFPEPPINPAPRLKNITMCGSPKMKWDESLPIGKTAAVFTPYGITFGGGEKYILSVVAAFQKMGYHITLLLKHGSSRCMNVDCTLRIAKEIGVEFLNKNKIRIKQVYISDSQIELNLKFEVFFALGNEKVPLVYGIGRVNFLMCQFPFDLDRTTTVMDQTKLESYDHIFLNSKFSLTWYSRFIQDSFFSMMDMHRTFPLVDILYPAVSAPLFPVQNPANVRRNIVMIGRIFRGRQSKGHDIAVDSFERFAQYLPSDVELHIIGSIVPGHELFARSLNRSSKRVILHFEISEQEKLQILESSLIIWHLTGINIDKISDDPASFEHFGISIVEGIHAGCIPVVLGIGGVTDIVLNGTSGFSGTSIDSILSLTLKVYSLSDVQKTALQKAALLHVQMFTFNRFYESLKTFVRKDILSQPFKHLIKINNKIVCSRQFRKLSRKNILLILETRMHYAFKYTLKNALFHLGSSWQVHIDHGNLNAEFVHKAVQGISGAVLFNLRVDSLSISELNSLMTNPSYWSRFAGHKGRILILQTDAIVLRGLNPIFLKYDYVGAPWHRGNDKWLHFQRSAPDGVGNGGVSLRSARAMLLLSRTSTYRSPELQQEDLFFSYQIQKDVRFMIAPRRVAYQFSIEVVCDDIISLDEVRPFALHAAWYYFQGSDRHRLYEYLEASVCGPVDHLM